MDNDLTSCKTKPVLPCKARGFGSPMTDTVGKSVSNPSAAELLLCSQVVHHRQEAKQGEETR